MTVPVLWDKKEQTIVNNESLEICKMFDQAFGAWCTGCAEFYPEPLRPTIDETVQAIYEPINNGVYKCGFASTQAAYDEAVDTLFEALQRWEDHLSGQRYLCGAQITLADWCMFTTLLRFDVVYYGHFKCNRQHLWQYPNLWNYLKELYQVSGVTKTIDLAQTKRHYYGSHRSINPTGIVPTGPRVDF